MNLMKGQDTAAASALANLRMPSPKEKARKSTTGNRIKMVVINI
jgi:hypothetical protein